MAKNCTLPPRVLKNVSRLLYPVASDPCVFFLGQTGGEPKSYTLQDLRSLACIYSIACTSFRGVWLICALAVSVISCTLSGTLSTTISLQPLSKQVWSVEGYLRTERMLWSADVLTARITQTATMHGSHWHPMVNTFNSKRTRSSPHHLKQLGSFIWWPLKETQPFGKENDTGPTPCACPLLLTISPGLMFAQVGLSVRQFLWPVQIRPAPLVLQVSERTERVFRSQERPLCWSCAEVRFAPLEFTNSIQLQRFTWVQWLFTSHLSWIQDALLIRSWHSWPFGGLS